MVASTEVSFAGGTAVAGEVFYVVVSAPPAVAPLLVGVGLAAPAGVGAPPAGDGVGLCAPALALLVVSAAEGCGGAPLSPSAAAAPALGLVEYI